MADILNLAIPYFGVIFIGFACGKTRGLPEAGLAWMNFFLLYVSLPALMFGIMAKTPFSELNNPPFLIATTLGTVIAFIVACLENGSTRGARTPGVFSKLPRARWGLTASELGRSIPRVIEGPGA